MLVRDSETAGGRIGGGAGCVAAAVGSATGAQPQTRTPPGQVAGGSGVLDRLTAMVADLADLADVADVAGLAGSVDGCGDAERVDRIALLDKIQAAAAAAQAKQITEFAESQQAVQRRQGVSARRLGHGVAEQVALARKVSPATGARQLGLARALTRHLPRTFALLAAGEISAWVATLMVRETSVLSDDHRRRVDAILAADLPTWSPRQAEAAARRVGIGLDPTSAIRRGRTARADRRVSIRPAPDTMALLTGFVPCEQGVAAWASLKRHANAQRLAGDPRSVAAIMADTYVERLTGQATAKAVPAEIATTMPAGSLLAGDDDVAATMAHYGPIPAALARHIAGVRPHQPDPASPSTPDQHGASVAPLPPEGTSGQTSRQPDDGDRVDGRGADCDRCQADHDRALVFLRRVFTDPVDNTVVAVDPNRRLFSPAQARLIGHRDQTCRVPYCTAPIRHHDHVIPHRDGGPTTTANGQGLCERDSYVKELPGWHVSVQPGNGPHTTVITTPTGHTYHSTAPPALRPGHTPNHQISPTARAKPSDRAAPTHRAMPTARANIPELRPEECFRRPLPGDGALAHADPGVLHRRADEGAATHDAFTRST